MKLRLPLALSGVCLLAGGQVQNRLVIENVTLIDGTGAAARPGTSVVIEGDLIAAVGPASRVRVPAGARVVSGAGKYLLPGLWEMHAHVIRYGESALPLFLANGITGVRDVGGPLSVLLPMRERIESGALLGPRLVVAGPILDGPGTARPATGLRDALRAAVPDAETGRRVVDSLAQLGVDLIKVHSGVPRPAYFAVLDQARRRGLPVAGHVPDEVTAFEAVRAGQFSIEHQFGIPIANARRSAELGARLVAAELTYRDTSAGRVHPMGTHYVRLEVDDSALADYDADSARRFAAEVVRHGTWLDPTLAVLQVASRIEEEAIAEPPELRYVPRSVQRQFDRQKRKDHPTEADIAAGRAKLARWLAAFGELHRAGARFITGTDVGFMGIVPGFSVHDEMGLLTQVGLTPMEAILAATRNSAEAAGQRHRVGTIEVGKAADLLLLDGDPVADIRNTRRIAAVITRGRLLDRVALDHLLAMALARAAGQ